MKLIIALAVAMTATAAQAAPGKMVPGAKMLIGVPDAQQRAALVQDRGTLKN